MRSLAGLMTLTYAAPATAQTPVCAISPADVCSNRTSSYYFCKILAALWEIMIWRVTLGGAKAWGGRLNSGPAREAKKQPDKAREAYENALSANPDFTQAQQRLEG